MIRYFSGAVGGFGVLVDSALEPVAAFSSLRHKHNWLAALVALVIFVFAGAMIQSPVIARGNADQFQKAFATGQMSALTQQQRDGLYQHALNPAFLETLANPSVYVMLVVLGMSLEAGMASLLLVFNGGKPNFPSLFAASLNIGAWTIGLYYLVTSVIVRVGFVTEGADAVFPSLLTFAQSSHDMFARGALACVNVFWAAAIPLKATAIRIIGETGTKGAYAIAAAIAVAEIVVSGILSKALG